MTNEQKANNLIHLFREWTEFDSDAKECALILVNEMFDEIHRISQVQDVNLNGTLKKWSDIKSELLRK